MLTLEERPQTFADMAGQKLVKTALLHICKDPENAPKTILLCGPYGSGKTTAARIFARALNCLNPKSNGDACGECAQCKADIQDSMFYSEYDAAIVGNVDSVRDLRNTFYFGYTKGYKVIVLDEVHLVTTRAQGALLKVFEEPEPNVFFLLCTTDPNKLLPTIVSRSLELRYDTIKKPEMLEHLHKVLDRRTEKLNLPEDTINKNLDLICDRSAGHMRNAIMLLDNLFLLKEDFYEVVKDSKPLFLRLINLSLNYQGLSQVKSKEEIDKVIFDTINQLTSFPVATLKQDFELVALDIVRSSFHSTSPEIDKLVYPYRNTFILINIFHDPAIYKLFTDDVQFQIAMHVLSDKLISVSRK